MGGKTDSEGSVNPNRVAKQSAHRPNINYEIAEKGLSNLKGNQAIRVKGQLIY